MKVSHYFLSLNPKYGGPTASVPIQCRGLAKEGVDTTLYTYSESRPFEKGLQEDGVHIIEYNKPTSFFKKKLHIALKNLLKQADDADIYHYHGVWLPSNHWVASAARRKGKKYVFNPRGDLETYRINYNTWKKVKKILIWHIYGKKDVQNANCIIATSIQELEAIRRQGITAPIAIIPNGIEMKNFPSKIVREEHEKKVVLFLSRVNPIKGLELLIEAWGKLPEDMKTGWELHIAGNSDPADYVHKLEVQIASLNLNETVKLLGPITGDAKMRKYMNSDLFILPTFNENFGNVVAEAMMCELPVITTKNAPWKVLEDYGCGWWIDLCVENLVNALKEAMALLDEERWELGKKGRQCIEENFASEAVAKKTMKVYEWVMGEADKPDYVEVL